ncbi:EamA family transporter, partial [Actinomadura sp. DSM 109109]|nr:EamA family transporter [Actinomadura lepetitiana]
LALLIRGRLPPLRWLALSAVLYTLVVSLLIASMTLSTAALGILLQYTSPAFCALFAVLFQRRRISHRTTLAMAIAAVGIAIMIAFQPREQKLWGPITGLLSGIAFGALILVLEKINNLTDGQASPFLIVFVNNAGAAIILFILAIAYDKFQ